MNSTRRFYVFAAGFVLVLALATVIWMRRGRAPETTREARAAVRNVAPDDAIARVSTRPPESVAPELRGRVAEALRDPAAAFRTFDDWRRRYALAGTEPARALLVAEGIAAAEQRRALLYEVIALDPELALRVALSRRERAQLPAAVAARLEEPLSGVGDFKVVATLREDAPDKRFRAVRREVVLDDRTFEAFVYGRRARLATHSGIALHGVAVDGRLALLDSPVRVLEGGEMPPAGRAVIETCEISGKPAAPGATTARDASVGVDAGDRVYYLCNAGHIALLETSLMARENGSAPRSGGPAPATASAQTTGAKRVLIIRVRFEDEEDHAEPQSVSSVQATFATADAFFRENSYGALTIQPVITPVYTLPHSADWYKAHDNSGYAFNILEAARALAANPAGFEDNEGLAAFNYLDFDFEAVRYNGGPGTFSGQAYIGVRGCWLKNSSAGVLAHELGHNLGLWHANYWEPLDARALTGAGSNREYGDIFDTMGTAGVGALHFSAAGKARLGWLGGDAVATALSSGQFRIHAHDLGGTLEHERNYALRIPRGDEREYWFEFRQHAGWSTNPWIMNGLGVRWDAWSSSNGGTQLLDSSALSPEGKNDSAIVIGRTYSDPVADIHVTPLYKNGTIPESIAVDVAIGPFPGNRAPRVSLVTFAAQAAVGEDVTLTAMASDPDAADASALVYAWDFGDRTLGANASAAQHAWTESGDYRVSVVVSDRKGGTATASALVRVGGPIGARVSGTVRDLDGRPLSDVLVATALGVEDLNYHAAMTDSDGTFVLTGVGNGSWNLTATKPGWEFAPVALASPLVVTGDLSGIDFLGRHGGWRITGVARYADGEPVVGALVSDGVSSEPTDASGAYAFVGMNPGVYTLRASKPGAAFPAVKVELDFSDVVVPTITESTFTVSGEITGVGSTAATISDGWHTTRSFVTGEGADAHNVFFLEDVPAGLWQMNAVVTDQRLVPASFSNPLEVAADRSDLAFANAAHSAAAGGIVRGYVTDRDVGLAGCTIRAADVTTTTDARGAYALLGVPTGACSVSVSAAGLAFAPGQYDVTMHPGGVLNLNFASNRPNPAPTFVQPVRTTGALSCPFIKLSAAATDDGGSAYVTYMWSVLEGAPGAVTFSRNGAHGAADTVASFSAAGSYGIRVTATDAAGASTTSDTKFTTQMLPVQMTIAPAAVSLHAGETATFSVICADQSGAMVDAPATVVWSVSGGGAISAEGVFMATTPGADFVVTARMAALAASGRVDVEPATGPGTGSTSPRITAPASANPAVIGSERATHLSVDATSDESGATLKYTWSALGVAPGLVTFAPNGTPAAKNSTARFAQTGRFALQVVVADAANRTATSSVVVTVEETLGSWRRRYFTPAELDNPAREETRWGEDADPDGDGVSNLLEYAFGLNPLVTEADAAPRPTFVTVNSVEYLAITFRQNRAATDVLVTPQASSDLKTWSAGLIPMGDPDAVEVTYRDSVPASHFEKRFLRVEVTGP